jgi:hypothetical protein
MGRSEFLEKHRSNFEKKIGLPLSCLRIKNKRRPPNVK